MTLKIKNAANDQLGDDPAGDSPLGGELSVAPRVNSRMQYPAVYREREKETKRIGFTGVGITGEREPAANDLLIVGEGGFMVNLRGLHAA
jgi:hypothetical protein